MKISIRHLAFALVAVVIGHGGITDRANSASVADASGKTSDLRPAAAKPTPILKRSHVAAWFDGPGDHLKYDADFIIQDMDIVDELDVGKWKALVARLHAQGKVFFAEMRPLTHLGKMFEYVMNDPGLQDALCVDFNLNPIRVDWMADRAYKDRPVYFYCSNHPRYRAFLRHQIFMFAEVGADGIMVDDGGGTPFAASSGGCCCRYCLAGFREYLRGKYTTDQLRAHGIDDLETFDYRQMLLKHADDRASFAAARRLGEIPLADDFREFLQRSDENLFQSLQEMASKLSGKHVPMAWDNVNFSGRYAPYYRFLDVCAPELDYQHFAVQGRGDDGKLPPGIVMLDKLADALGKWHAFTPAPGAWSAIKRKNLTGLLRLWVAASYANGGLPRYPRKGWCFGETSRWYYPPKESFEPLYDFVRTHRELLDGYENVAQVGVVYADPSSGPTSLQKHVCESLVGLNVPFGIVVAGNQWVPNRLSPEDAQRFELVLIPEPAGLDAAQRQVVEGWKKQKAAITVSEKEDVHQLLAGRVDPLTSLEGNHSVWLFPRAIPGSKGSSLVCHLVNWSYDSQKNEALPQTDVKIRLRSARTGDSRVTRVTFHTIGKAAQSLPFAVLEDAIHVAIPEVELWGILQLE
jgi:hypothetical protein